MTMLRKIWSVVCVALLLVGMSPVDAATTAQKAATSGSCPQSLRLNGGVCPPYSFNFATNRAKTPKGITAAAPLLSVTRAQTVSSYAVDSAGNWQAFAASTPRITNLGLTVEEARTNSIRNNTPSNGSAVGTVRTISGITGLSRTASASAVLLASNTGATAVNDLITISGASVGTYNGGWLVTAVSANTSITFATATNTTDSATGETVSAVSPGTLPTNWFVSLNGFAGTVVATGTLNGVGYIDYRMAGVSTGQFPAITFDVVATVSAAYGQTWTCSAFDARIVATDVANVSSQGTQFINQGGSFRAACYNANTTASLLRGSGSFTINNSADTGIAFKYQVAMSGASGQTMDQTVRIGWPQLENNSLINSTVASAALATGGAGGTGTTPRSMFLTGGTSASNASVNVTIAAGAVSVVNSVVPGSYTSFPPSPATLYDAVFAGNITGTTLTVSQFGQGVVAIGQTVYLGGVTAGTVITGGSGSSWTVNNSQTTGAKTFATAFFTTPPTVTLTPTDNAAQGFATTPIPTTTVGVARAADVVTIASPPVFGPAFTIYAQGTLSATTTYTQTRPILSADDGTLTNRSQIFMPASQAVLGGFMSNAGGSSSWGTRSIATGVAFKSAATFAANNQVIAVNGQAAEAAGAPVATAPVATQLSIGKRADGGTFWNGTIAKIGIHPTQAFPASQLQSITSGP